MFTEIREGQVWRRKLTRKLWRVEGLPPIAMVAIKIEEPGAEDRELLECDDFMKKFEDPMTPVFFRDGDS